MLRPKSIAVLGSVWAANVIEQCDRIGFGGDIWPVHPTHDHIGGRACFRSVHDLPMPPDVTFVGVNRSASVDVVRDLSAMGAGGAICFASGWAESGAADLQAELVSVAGDMPVLGPNCYGLLNLLDRAVIWPDQHGALPCDRGVAILSQSSNIAINLTMQARGLPIAYVACLGNAAQVGMAELAHAMLADDRVTALGLYAEGFDDAQVMAQLAQQARRDGKGIVVLKAGKTAAGAAAAVSHTAALVGGGAASSAFLAQSGMGEVRDLATLIETLKILHVHGPLPGRRLCSLSCSGGEAGLVSDLAAAYELEFPPLSVDQTQKLGDILGPLVTLSNPLDYHTFIWGDLDKTAAVFAQTLRPFDAGLFVVDPPRADRCDPASFKPALDAIQMAATETGKPAFPVATLPENYDETWIGGQIAQGVVPLCGLDTALAAIEAASLPAPPAWHPGRAQPVRDCLMLDEAAGKQVLAQAGIAVPNGVVAPDLNALAPLAKTLKPPLALKGLGFAHKSDAGAVRLNVTDVTAQAEMQGATGYLAEEMVTGAVAELIIAVQRDAVYGVTLTLGFGGMQAELLADVVTLVLPITPSDIRTALNRLKLAPLLHGYRGKPAADIDAVVDVALLLQDLLHKSPDIEDIEINPLLACDSGAVAVDALIRKDKI